MSIAKRRIPRSSTEKNEKSHSPVIKIFKWTSQSQMFPAVNSILSLIPIHLSQTALRSSNLTSLS